MSISHKKEKILVVSIVIAISAMLCFIQGRFRLPIHFARAATTYYVDIQDGSCSDSGPGSQILPFCHLQAAADVATQPGDVVNIADGIYREFTTLNHSGTTNSPITFQATGDQAILTAGVPLDETLFVKTPGYDNVYEIQESQIPPDAYYQGQFDLDGKVVQLDGVTYYTLPTAWDFDRELHQNPAQKTTSVALVEANIYSWYFDTTPGVRKLYIHTREGMAPSGHEYEFIKRYDIAAATSQTIKLEANVHDIVLDHFIFRYSGVFHSSGNINITVQNFEAIGQGMGIGGGSDNFVFRNCYIHDGLPGTSGNYGDGLGIGLSTNAQVLNCIIEKFDNNIQWQDGNTNTLFDGVISRDCDNHGMNGRNSVNFTIINSIFLRCQDAFYLRPGDQGMTIINSLFPAIIFQRANLDCGNPTDITIRNSIFTGYAKQTIEPTCPELQWSDLNLDSDYNYFLPGDGGYWLEQTGWLEICHSTGDSLAICQSDTGQDAHSNVFTGSTIWQDWNLDDFHLVEGSPVRDNGTAFENDHDYDNVVRPQGSGYDIGPFEFPVAAPINISPVLISIGPKTAHERDAINFTVIATDEDVGDTLTFTAEPLPSGALFTDHGDRTATFAWTPSDQQSGEYPVTVTVSDGTDTDTEDITITVLDGASNCDPDWQCTNWSACTSGLQTRTCTDVNRCGTDAGRPSETAVCDSVAPGMITNLTAQ